jgi:hypothetical protein
VTLLYDILNLAKRSISWSPLDSKIPALGVLKERILRLILVAIDIDIESV